MWQSLAIDNSSSAPGFCRPCRGWLLLGDGTQRSRAGLSSGGPPGLEEGQWGQICPFDKSSSGPKALRIEGSGPWYRVVNLTRFPILGSSGD